MYRNNEYQILDEEDRPKRKPLIGPNWWRRWDAHVIIGGLLSAIMLFIIFAIYIGEQENKRRRSASCEEFAGEKMADVPFRCLNYFK